jgi:hypothetical protein
MFLLVCKHKLPRLPIPLEIEIFQMKGEKRTKPVTNLKNKLNKNTSPFISSKFSKKKQMYSTMVVEKEMLVSQSPMIIDE